MAVPHKSDDLTAQKRRCFLPINMYFLYIKYTLRMFRCLTIQDSTIKQLNMFSQFANAL